MATGVYIDGFNLYYGSLKGSPYKWLDLRLLASALLPREEIVRVCYFTAIVDGVRDAFAPQRQQTYLRALATKPDIKVVLGHFVTRLARMPLHPAPVHGPRTVEVLKTEEKGSDVNLGCHALLDAMQGRLDTVVIVSNDADLREPVRLIVENTGCRVGVVNPHPRHLRSRELSRFATFTKTLTAYHLGESQFPAILRDERGEVRKPTRW